MNNDVSKLASMLRLLPAAQCSKARKSSSSAVTTCADAWAVPCLWLLLMPIGLGPSASPLCSKSPTAYAD